jgi:two-component system, LytTR family, response regulator
MNEYGDNHGMRTPRIRGRLFWGLALLLAFLVYAATFWLIRDGSIADAAAASLRNLFPLVIVTATAVPLLRHYVLPLQPWPALAIHLLAAPVFAFLWYWLLTVLMGLTNGDGVTSFRVTPYFASGPLAWQLLQGITVYSLVAAITYVRAIPPQPGLPIVAWESEPQDSETGPSRYFVREGDQIRPLDLARIVMITGADDYAEVVTTSGKHLIRVTLAELERSLPPDRFLRIHRSRIVNADRIERAEPDGTGRLLLHMDNGQTVHASRAGAKVFRERVV